MDNQIKSNLGINKQEFFIQEYFKISILNINLFGMLHLKDINVLQRLKETLDQTTINESDWLF